MIFLDFEVYRKDWLVVLYDMKKQERLVIINDREQLLNFWKEHRKEIFAGFNIVRYDSYIFKAILLGLDPYNVSNWIIKEGKQGYQYSSEFRRYPLVTYDVMNSLDRGLKYFEGSLGNSIEESKVSFDLDRKLTAEELKEVVKYCIHDVEQTIEVFLQRQADFEAQLGLIKMFKLPLSELRKTKTQLSATILEAEYKTYYDALKIDFPDTLRLSDKYSKVIDWYKEIISWDLAYIRLHWVDKFYNGDEKKAIKNKSKIPTNGFELQKFIYSQSYKIDIGGVPHVFGWGGVHGARENYHATGLFLNMDVASLYPSLMINYNLHSRSCKPEKYVEIYHERLRLKKAKDPLNNSLKLVLNSTYGALKDVNNPLCDQRQANRICVYGQLLLLDLLEKLEPIAEIVQSNTDGMLVRKPDAYQEEAWLKAVDDITAEWMQRTGLTLEFDRYKEVFQGDVNNYVIIDEDGEFKSKGAYVKKLSPLDYDLKIVNQALIDYMVNGVPIGWTINNCECLKDFQLVKKISGKYTSIYYGKATEVAQQLSFFEGQPETKYALGKELIKINEKTVRVFASYDPKDGGLYKQHATTEKLAKLEGTPERCRIVNGDINGKACPVWIDKEWYINLAKERIKKFGIL